MARRYIAYNGVSPTTAAQVKATTGTSIKSLLQVATPSTTGLHVIEWGISFDGNITAQAGNTPIECELLQTDVAATVTSVTPTVYGVDTTASLCIGGTSATGHSASAEGTITSTRVFDAQLLYPTSGYVKQFPLGREPYVPVSKFLRVRVTAGSAVNAYCYILWEES